METVNPQNKSHRDLIDEACLYFAELERQNNERLSLSRALPRGRRRLAERLRLKERTIRRMWEVDRVASYHWEDIERATSGRVKAADFEAAKCTGSTARS